MNKISILLGGIVLLAIVGFLGWQKSGKSSSIDTQNIPIASDKNPTPNIGNKFQPPQKVLTMKAIPPLMVLPLQEFQ